MQFKGSPEFEKFWSLLETESTRGMVIVIAAYFDVRLKQLLGSRSDSLYHHINSALAMGLLTENEHDDLHRIRNLRNAFAHDLHTNDFDQKMVKQINSLKTWTIATSSISRYEKLFPSVKDRLLYVAAVFAARLQHRKPVATQHLPEPPFHDTDAWPPVSSVEKQE